MVLNGNYTYNGKNFVVYINAKSILKKRKMGHTLNQTNDTLVNLEISQKIRFCNVNVRKNDNIQIIKIYRTL